MTNTEKYTHDLMVALRCNNVPGDRIGDVLAEVESHLAATGEDPREAFGDPTEYAETVAAPLKGWRRRSMVVETVIGAAIGLMVADGVFNLIIGESSLFGLPAWVVLLAGLGLGGVAVVLVSHLRDAVVDPRTGRQIAPPAGRTIAIVTTVMAVLVAGLAVLTRIT